jgi:hypothetical protein
MMADMTLDDVHVAEGSSFSYHVLWIVIHNKMQYKALTRMEHA